MQQNNYEVITNNFVFRSDAGRRIESFPPPEYDSKQTIPTPD